LPSDCMRTCRMAAWRGAGRRWVAGRRLCGGLAGAARAVQERQHSPGGQRRVQRRPEPCAPVPTTTPPAAQSARMGAAWAPPPQPPQPPPAAAHHSRPFGRAHLDQVGGAGDADAERAGGQAGGDLHVQRHVAHVVLAHVQRLDLRGGGARAGGGVGGAGTGRAWGEGCWVLDAEARRAGGRAGGRDGRRCCGPVLTGS
jgi:hypothetical protein